MDLIIVVVLSSTFVFMGIIACALYFCWRFYSKARDRFLPPERTNYFQSNPSAPSAPDYDFSQFPITHTSQEFQHLFPTDNVNIVDRDRVIYHSNNDQRIPSNNIDNGFNQSDHGFVYPSTRRAYGFNHPSDIDYGLIYTTDHGFSRSVEAINNPSSNIHGARQYSSINSYHGYNQSSSYHKPLKKIETPPPNYYEALMGNNPRDYIHRQNPITCERLKGADRNGSGHSGGASGGGSSDGRTGSLSNTEAPVGSGDGRTASLSNTKGPGGSSDGRTGSLSNTEAPVGSNYGRTGSLSNTEAPVGSNYGRTGSLSNTEALVGRNHSSNHQLIVRNTSDGTNSPSGYSDRRGGGKSNGRNGSEYSGGRSDGNSTVHSYRRGGYRNNTGYSSGRGKGRYSGGRIGGSSTDYWWK